MQRTKATVARIEKIIRGEPSVVNIVALVGLDLLSQSNSTNGATIFVVHSSACTRRDPVRGLRAFAKTGDQFEM